MKNITYLLILFLIYASSCRTKRFVDQKQTTNVRDTVIYTRTIDRYKSITDTLLVENACDSLGILKDFYSKFITPQGKVVIRSVRGNIEAVINMDSIQSVYENKYKSKNNVQIKTEKVMLKTNIIPLWALITIIIESAIIMLYIYLRFIKK